VFFTQGSNNNLVQGNYIGTNAAGSAALGNAQNGVKILGSPNITVGGLTAGARNIISGNGNDGVLVNSDGANPSKVQGNYIGTDASGSFALGNGAAGVGLFTANNIVGGTTLQARNIISGNGREGVYIAAIGNYVQGNFIGTNAAGTAALGNVLDGVKMDGAPSNFVGGTEAGARNVISGNQGVGLMISGGGASNNIVQGNFIGTNAAGTAALGNIHNGVTMDGAPSTVIGGTEVGARNIISGNKGVGLLISGSGASNTTIQGNFIGTDVNGTTGLQNEDYGISVSSASNNLIGGTSAGARNVISKNKGDGIAFFEGVSGKSSGNLVQGNFIGTDVTGTVPMGNGGNGVGLYGSPNNTVGGADAAARNIISGNMRGVSTSFTADGNKIQGNYIGTDVSGTANLGNALDGVEIVNSVNTIIGGGAGLGNIIAFNGARGVTIKGTVPKNNALLNNSIFSNGQVGIDLKNDGVTPNDAGDADTGPNNLQNFPGITSAVNNLSTNMTTVQGTINSNANTAFTVQFFSSAAADPTGFGEGQTFRGSTTVTTDASGNAAFNLSLSLIPEGQVVTATATDPANNTSEFSQAVQVLGPTPTPTPTSTPPTIQFSSSAYSVGEGGGHVTITVTREGDTSGAATVDYRTQDTDTFTVGCADTVNNMGSAYGRCDFATVVGTFTLAAGEMMKTFDVPIIDDSRHEDNETFSVVLSNPTGATLGSPSTAAVIIIDNDTFDRPNPILQTDNPGIAFFVRQHYLDFLGREPEPGEPWSPILRGCADQFNVDPNNPSAACDRITVSGAFFGSPEFKDKGFFVIDFYRVAFGRLPQYPEFVTDLASLVGATAQEVFARRAAFATNFVQRPEFATIAALPNSDYVTTLMAGTNNQNYNLTSITTPDPKNPDGTTKVTLTTSDLINALNANTLTKAQVLRAIVQSDEIINIEAVSTFVASQYYGYLRRTPEQAGFNAWVNYLTTHPTDFRTMVNGFENSIEYRLRFGP
jgi:Calx-beta domain